MFGSKKKKPKNRQLHFHGVRLRRPLLCALLAVLGVAVVGVGMDVGA
jgi:hypothetical protein